MLDWFRNSNRGVYQSAVSTLAGNRKLRPVFIQKKPLAEQYAWIHKTLKLNACDAIGEHLLQAYLMGARQPLLAAFCDGMGIPHDGKGSVAGELPRELDDARLKAAVEQLLGAHDPVVVAVYLHCFNLQVPGGWPELTALLVADGRLKLG
jgi:hypothetical protein